MKNNTPVGYLLIGLGLALSGWFIGHGFVSGRTADRFVTVKGVSERDVEADLGLWPLQVVANANSLEEAQATIDASLAKVRSFLSDHDLGETHLELQGVEVTDRLANPYGDPGIRGGRFVVQQKLMVRSDEPILIHLASQAVGELVSKGVVLSSGTGWGPATPTFLFKSLNALKPEMIAEATASAREAASRFAADSDSRLGNIRRANQGIFVVLARDAAAGIPENSQLNKTIRVVATVEYFLD
ncbi:MAG: SIMPL domain-containing protein [Bacteroidetes Order II. Incertae sedis bacterium]|jgi:uncharacterized protein|nr:SIMPL domain-containing protein [Bacteroidetes Order II. bacterium]MBT4052098.1 SIMPL domain-containing protein [Bacteroidetes Order II. bacterium]MBT5249271.1 SIMPL domain-containing protein [Bacteroidetes Order II. bacterium]MBT6199593.1 SIMPL domain-containing protein [Bacteroidetes Order II. bacterium]MBT6424864.1 SIMPL domain-containing protein [Bacteroidetes Order II. bacterium]